MAQRRDPKLITVCLDFDEGYIFTPIALYLEADQRDTTAPNALRLSRNQVAAWLSRADRDGSLAAFLNPNLTPPERTMAQAEGWILGGVA